MLTLSTCTHRLAADAVPTSTFRNTIVGLATAVLLIGCTDEPTTIAVAEEDFQRVQAEANNSFFPQAKIVDFEGPSFVGAGAHEWVVWLEMEPSGMTQCYNWFYRVPGVGTWTVVKTESNTGFSSAYERSVSFGDPTFELRVWVGYVVGDCLPGESGWNPDARVHAVNVLPPAAYIDGPGQIWEAGYYVWEASYPEGQTPFTYQWQINYHNYPGWGNLGTQETQGLNVAANDGGFSLRVTVTTADSIDAVGHLNVENYAGCPPPEVVC